MKAREASHPWCQEPSRASPPSHSCYPRNPNNPSTLANLHIPQGTIPWSTEHNVHTSLQHLGTSAPQSSP